MSYTIKDILEEEEGNFKSIVVEEGDKFEYATEISENDVNFDFDIARDWVIINDEGIDHELHILVQPEKVIKYVHVGAQAPQYVINSISRIAGAISYAATQLSIYARTESSRHSIPVDIILIPDVTDEQIAELFQKAKENMEDEGCTGVDCSSTGLTYDAGTASIEDAEPSRNW